MQSGDSRNLVITGFMGTGKSTVGQEVARRLHRPFVDMDREIEKRAGKPVPSIFAEDGEATFRQMEATLCEELGRQHGQVIATGGGALVDPNNRERLMGSGIVVCLTCTVDEIMRRVNYSVNSDRPLLYAADPRAEIERLLGVRHQAYAAIPWWIDTTGRSVEVVATQIEKLSRVIIIPVHIPGRAVGPETTAKYFVHIGNGLLEHVGGALRAVGVSEGGRIALVSNPVVAALYGNRVEVSLQSAGFQPFACSVPDGEENKTLATVSSLYDQFLDGGLERSGTVISLGGGVTGDIAGFAAASFMRGVRFAQIPTTLLAMVDASVGGKTGVDLRQGKNLVGAFKQPKLVIVDPNVLATLPRTEMRSGLAEVIKHAVIGSPDLFAELEATDDALSVWWGNRAAGRIERALRVKIDIVEQDPYEQGRRAVLNLGHTVGHALEKLSSFSLRHGEAVAIGMVTAAHVAAELGRADPGLGDRIAAVLTAWGLPTSCPSFTADEVWEAMAHDKKRKGRDLRWVLPHTIGEVTITEDVPPYVVKSVLTDLGARSGR